MHKWLFSGELYDPYNEFFVSVDPELAHMQYLLHPSSLAGGVDGVFGALSGEAEDISAEREGGLRLWEAKYQFRRDMLPMFVGEAFGKKVRKQLTSKGGLKLSTVIDLLDRKESELHTVQLS